MTPEEVKEYFSTTYNFQKVTKMSNNTLCNWLKWGYVPYLSQKKIEILTNSKLIAEWHPKELEVREKGYSHD